MSGTPQRTGAAPTFDCSGFIATSPPYGNRVRSRNASFATKSLFHYCEFCGEAVCAGQNGWRHINVSGRCPHVITNPVVAIKKVPALQAQVDLEAQWAQERAELLTELDVATAGRQRLVTELRELYERVCIHNCSNGFVLSRDRIDEIEDLLATYS